MGRLETCWRCDMIYSSPLTDPDCIMRIWKILLYEFSGGHTPWRHSVGHNSGKYEILLCVSLYLFRFYGEGKKKTFNFKLLIYVYSQKYYNYHIDSSLEMTSDAPTIVGRVKCQTWQVPVTSDTQKIQSFDWPKFYCKFPPFVTCHFRWSDKRIVDASFNIILNFILPITVLTAWGKW